MKKVLSTILTLALATGSAATAAAFNSAENDYAGGKDLLAFYSGHKIETRRSYTHLLPSPGREKPGFFSLSDGSGDTPENWVTLQPSFLPQNITLLSSYQASPVSRQKNPSAPTIKLEDDNGRKNDGHYGIKAAGEYSFGNYYAVTGFSYDRKIPDSATGANEQQMKNLGISMGAGKRTNDLTAGLMYVYMTGDESIGNDFQSFVILPAPNTAGKDNNSALNEVHALSFYADYDLTQQFNIRTTLGFAKIEKSPEADALPKESGFRWGVGLDASYKLLDNLVYGAHFGYLDKGESFDKAAAGDESQTSLADSPPVYQLSNHLTMTF